jgi:hypothetical protein
MGIQPGDSGEHEVVSDSVKMQKELLWGDYLELLNQSRHVEMVRVNAINLVLVLTAALAALITFDKEIDLTDLPPSLIITATGLFSTLFSLAYLARYDKNKRRAALVRAELDRRFFAEQSLGSGMAALRDEADRSMPATHHSQRTARLYDLTLAAAKRTTGTTHFFWVLVPISVVLIGILLTILSIVGIEAEGE